MIPAYPAYSLSIHHDSSGCYVRKGSKGSDLRLGEEVTIRLWAARDAPIDRVFLRICPDGEQQFIEMELGEEAPACHWWEARLRVTMLVFNYRFLILAGVGVYHRILGCEGLAQIR